MTLFKRWARFVLGMSLVAFGIALTARSDLGTSPISSIAYAWYKITLETRIPTLSLGVTSLVMNIVFFLIQWAIAGRRFPKVQFLQIPATFLFGAVIDFAGWVFSPIPVTTYWGRLLEVLLGSALVALGLVFELSGDILYLPGDGLVKSLNELFKLNFSTMKIVNDVTLVLLAALSSYFALRHVVGVREGTVIAALCVGWFIKFFRPFVPRVAPVKSAAKDGYVSVDA
ncbi:MAG: DUF6198 family protein [Planctomycetia bacterium]|nr:DUF6198 family protein [Planctomycetia bacterium]